MDRRHQWKAASRTAPARPSAGSSESQGRPSVMGWVVFPAPCSKPWRVRVAIAHGIDEPLRVTVAAMLLSNAELHQHEDARAFAETVDGVASQLVASQGAQDSAL